MRFIKLLTFITACTIALFISFSSADEALPSEITSSVKSGHILCSTHAVLPDGDCWFILLQTESGANQLKCYVLKEKEYSLLFESEASIPQSPNKILLDIEYNMEDITTHEIYGFPVLTISQMDANSEYVELFIAYKYETLDTWKILRIWDYSDFGNIIFDDNSIQLYEDIESDRILLSEQFDINRDLRTLDLSSVQNYIKEITKNFLESIDDYNMHG